MKKIISALCAFALALALPAAAFAADSPTGNYTSNTSASSLGSSMTVSVSNPSALSSQALADFNAGNVLWVTTTDAQASNTTVGTNEVILGKFEAGFGATAGDASLDGDLSGIDMTLAITGISSSYNGNTAKVFVQHSAACGGGTEVQTATISNGAVSVHMTGLSTITVVVDKSTTNSSTNSSSTSPQTGVTVAGGAAAVAVLAAAAGCVAFALRKKTNE